MASVPRAAASEGTSTARPPVARAACAAIFGCGTATGTTSPSPTPWNTSRPSPTFPVAADHTTAPERQREGLRNQRFAAVRRFDSKEPVQMMFQQRAPAASVKHYRVADGG